MELCHNKTKLLYFPAPSSYPDVFYNPIKVNNRQIEFSKQAEHVGVVWSPTGTYLQGSQPIGKPLAQFCSLVLQEITEEI